MAQTVISARYAVNHTANGKYYLESPKVEDDANSRIVMNTMGISIDDCVAKVPITLVNDDSITSQATVSLIPYIVTLANDGTSPYFTIKRQLSQAKTETVSIHEFENDSISIDFSLSVNYAFSNTEALYLDVSHDGSTEWFKFQSIPSISIDDSSGTNPDNPSQPETVSIVATPRSVSLSSFEVGSIMVLGVFNWSLSELPSTWSYVSTNIEYRQAGSTNVNRFSASGNVTSKEETMWLAENATYEWRTKAIAHESYYDDITEIEGELVEGAWSDWSTFTTGSYPTEPIYDVTCSIIKPKSNNKRNGAAEIPFSFTVSSQGYPSAYEAIYTIDGGETWNALASGSINGESEVQFVVPAMTFPSGSISWQVRAKTNGDFTNNWASASFTVTYEGYGAIKATSGPINRGVLSTSPITFAATIEIIGQTADTPVFQEAQFYWRSGEANSFVGYNMTISNDAAQITVPVDTFPVGLVQWFMYGKDSGGVESETPIYATYVLKSIIDSFPVKPSSSIEQTENAIEFSWGYISLNGEALNKAEIQFSEDGVTWGTIVPIESYEEEAPLIPPSGEDVFEEEVSE